MTITPILCTPVDQGPSFVEGSTVEACFTCGVAVWVAPSSRELIARLGAKPICSSHVLAGLRTAFDIARRLRALRRAARLS